MAEEQLPQMFVDEAATAGQRAALLEFEIVSAEFSGSQVVAAFNLVEQHPDAINDVVVLIDQPDRTEALLTACRNLLTTGAIAAISGYDEKTEWAIEKDRTFQDIRATLSYPSRLIQNDPEKLAAHREKARREMARRGFMIFAGRLTRQEVEVQPVEEVVEPDLQEAG